MSIRMAPCIQAIRVVKLSIRINCKSLAGNAFVYKSAEALATETARRNVYASKRRIEIGQTVVTGMGGTEADKYRHTGTQLLHNRKIGMRPLQIANHVRK